MRQLKSGVEPREVVFEKKIAVVRNRSVGWLVNAYEAINNRELVKKVICLLVHFKLPFLTIFL